MPKPVYGTFSPRLRRQSEPCRVTLAVNTPFTGDHQRTIVNMFSRFSAVVTISIPLFSSAPRTPSAPRPYHPQLLRRGHLSHNMQRFFNDIGIVREVIVQLEIIASLAPFCGPKMRDAPLSPPADW